MRTIIDPVVLAVDLKEYRAKRSKKEGRTVTQEMVAKELGIFTQTYQRWENARCRISPAMYRLLVIAGVISLPRSSPAKPR